MRRKLSCFIVQTSDCWPLAPLLVKLNARQDVFEFTHVEFNSSGERLRIKPQVHLREASSLPVGSTRRKILESYLTERDWAEQTHAFLHLCPAAKSFDSARDLAIVVGAGVYVLDTPGVEFIESREEDSYACIYDFRFSENATSTLRNLNRGQIDPLLSFAAISVLKVESVFNKSQPMRPLHVRTSRARYLTANLAHFVSSRAFWTTLASEHSGQKCLMETNLGGGDYLAGYYTEGICDFCREAVESKQPQMSGRLPLFQTDEVIHALSELCTLPNTWDKRVRSIEVLRGKLVPSLASALALGLGTNLLAGFSKDSGAGTTQFHQFMVYLLQHGVATIFSVIAGVLALAALAVAQMLQLGLP